jgi:hypothetical protein
MTQIGSSRSRPLRGHRAGRNTRRSATRTGYSHYANSAQQNLSTAAWSPGVTLEWGKFPDVVLIGALLILLVLLFSSVRFFVGGIELIGDKVISAQEIMEATGLRNDSIFYVNTEQITQAIRREFPSITSVKVSCGLPARVRITVQEREAQAVWETANGRFLVDSAGRALKTVPSADKEALVIRDRTGQLLKICEQAPTPTPEKGKEKAVESCAANKAAVQTVIALRPLLGDVRIFDYYQDKGISVTSPNGWPVYFGLGGDLELKVANLRALLGEIAGRGLSKIDYIDVRFEKSPLYRQGN